MKLNTIVAVVYLLLSLLLYPVTYYEIFGSVSILLGLFNNLLGLGLFIWLPVRLNKVDKLAYYNFHIFGLFVAVILGLSLSFFYQPIEFLDWHLRKSVRNEIIREVKSGKLKPDFPYGGIFPLGNSFFPPISNGGNDIAIEYGKDKSVTVEFYISRGLLDHYSAFVYTNDNKRMKEIEEMIGGNVHGTKKLDSNWYRVSY